MCTVSQWDCVWSGMKRRGMYIEMNSLAMAQRFSVNITDKVPKLNLNEWFRLRSGEWWWYMNSYCDSSGHFEFHIPIFMTQSAIKSGGYVFQLSQDTRLHTTPCNFVFAKDIPAWLNRWLCICITHLIIFEILKPIENHWELVLWKIPFWQFLESHYIMYILHRIQ